MVYSSSGTCSGSDKGLVIMDDERKRKRMESNRESARRSRLKKQQHLEDLMAHTAQLRKRNDQLLINISVTKQHTVTAEAENSVLRAQLVELTHRLQSLKGILTYIGSSPAAATTGGAGGGGCMVGAEGLEGFGEGLLGSAWGMMGKKKHPIMASAEMFDY